MSSCCVFSFKRLSVRVVISASSCDPGARSLFLTEVTNRLHLFRLNTFITMRIIFFICDVVLLTFSFYHLWDAVLWSVWFYWESWGLFPFVSACNCLAEEWTTLFCFQHIQRVHRAWRVTVQPVLLRSAHALPQLRGTNSSAFIVLWLHCCTFMGKFFLIFSGCKSRTRLSTLSEAFILSFQKNWVTSSFYCKSSRSQSPAAHY